MNFAELGLIAVVIIVIVVILKQKSNQDGSYHANSGIPTYLENDYRRDSQQEYRNSDDRHSHQHQNNYSSNDNYDRGHGEIGSREVSHDQGHNYNYDNYSQDTGNSGNDWGGNTESDSGGGSYDNVNAE